MTSRPLFLITNDDGHFAKGIRALRDALLPHADVVICAPETEQSATSHSLSLHRPLRLREVESGIFAVDGTPADCVYVALFADTRVLPRRPDFVVSGLNHGLNLGTDAFYSGTVGGAREAALRGFPALACSADGKADRGAAAALAAQVALSLAEKPMRGLHNLNVPRGSGPWELRGTILGTRQYSDQVSFITDPRGREWLWIGTGVPTHEDIPETDTEAHDAGFASLSPLLLDLTDNAAVAATRVFAATIKLLSYLRPGRSRSPFRRFVQSAVTEGGSESGLAARGGGFLRAEWPCCRTTGGHGHRKPGGSGRQAAL